MPLAKGRRKLGWALGLLLGLPFALWLSCPVWFPWVLRAGAARASVGIGSYERIGYSRFALHNVVLTNNSAALRIDRVNGLVPSVWAARLLVPSSSVPAFLTVTNWRCLLVPAKGTARPGQPTSAQVTDAARLVATLTKWLPRAELLDGAVYAGSNVVYIPNAIWNRGTLQTRLNLPAVHALGNINLTVTPAQPFAVELQCAPGITSRLLIITNSSGVDVQNLTDWTNNHVQAFAHFGAHDFLPATAAIEATNVQVPGTLVGLPQYALLSTSLRGRWQDRNFSLQLSGHGEPAPGQSNLPPIELNVIAEGNTNLARVTALQIRSPILRTDLSGPVEVSFSSPYLRAPVAMEVNADLSRQPWLALQGSVRGRVELSPTPGAPVPRAVLALTGTNVGNQFLIAESANLTAKVDWPVVTVSSAELRFDDGSTAKLAGALDLQRKSASQGQFRAAGRLLQRWLPADYSYDQLSVSGTFQGPWESLAHSGNLAVRHILTPQVPPSDLELGWTGRGAELSHFDLRVQELSSAIAVSGGLSLSSNRTELDLQQLTLSTNGAEALSLSKPVTATLSTHPAQGWQINATPFQLRGPMGEFALQASLQWPSQGQVDLAIDRFPLDSVTRFVRLSVPRVQVSHFGAALQWSNGPARLNLQLAGGGTAELARPDFSQDRTTTVPEKPNATAAQNLLATPLRFEANLNGTERGLVLSNLVVNTSTSSVVTAHGSLPIVLNPSSATNLVDWIPHQPLNLDASVRPEAFFWKLVSDLSGVRLVDPVLELSVNGDWQAPVGKVQLRAQEIKLQDTNFTRIDLEQVRVDVSLDRNQVRITDAEVLVQKQKVSLSAELPMGEQAWSRLAHHELPPLDQARGRVLIDNAELAAFEPIFPELLAPQGNLNLDLQLQPGLRLEGAVVLRRARTRPLGNTAPLRDINVTLRCRDRMLVLENATANLSGAEVNLTGNLDLRGTNWLHGALPPFTLALRGTNVPLARQPEYIIRSDLDLTVAKTNDLPAVVFGAAHLRDSFYLSDLTSLVSSGPASPGSRPPFFSIDNPILADWKLAVNVDGVRWLKLRTSLFNGEVSANFHLQGTLSEPIALGDLKIDSGIVRFPFANLAVQQGLVTLSSGNPYHPQLLVRAASKQFGYDIRMEVTGAADAPVIQFTSNPSLSSEQILLMITAGQLPAGAYSLTPQQRAQTVALFLGRDLLAKLGLGDQSQERLTISSGEEISEQGRPTYHVEYKLTKRWSLEGEYDRFGDFNAGLKWRVYSK